MKKLSILTIAAAFTMVSCKDSKAEATTTDNTTTNTAVEEAHTNHEGHDHSNESATTTQGATNATTSQAPKDGINPPHGQPGHRCDIAVGAPLNSAPAKQQNAQPTQAAQPAPNGQGFLGQGNAQAAPQQIQATPQQAAKPAQVTAPGMQGKPNPAHGQPGHRCDISVGQPLP